MIEINATSRLMAAAPKFKGQNVKDLTLLKEFAKLSGGKLHVEEDHTCVDLPTKKLYKQAKDFLKAAGYKHTGEDNYVKGPSTFTIEDDGEQLTLSFMLV